MKESARAKKGFEIYYKLGPDRSLAEVGRKLGISKVSVEKMSSAHSWVERVEKRDSKVSETALDNHDEMLAQAKRENFEIIRLAKEKLKAKIKKIEKDGGVFDVSLTEFERLAKLELLMLGDPTERISDDTITGLIKRAAQLERLNKS